MSSRVRQQPRLRVNQFNVIGVGHIQLVACNREIESVWPAKRRDSGVAAPRHSHRYGCVAAPCSHTSLPGHTNFRFLCYRPLAPANGIENCQTPVLVSLFRYLCLERRANACVSQYGFSSVGTRVKFRLPSEKSIRFICTAISVSRH